MKIFQFIVYSAFFCFAHFCLTGCGHNAIQYSDGIGFETSIRPDHGNFGVIFRYGKILSATARENTTIEMTGSGQGDIHETLNEDSPSGKAYSEGTLKISIGPQISGYYVDALQAGADSSQLNEYLESRQYPSSESNDFSASNSVEIIKE